MNMYIYIYIYVCIYICIYIYIYNVIDICCSIGAGRQADARQTTDYYHYLLVVVLLVVVLLVVVLLCSLVAVLVFLSLSLSFQTNPAAPKLIARKLILTFKKQSNCVSSDVFFP